MTRPDLAQRHALHGLAAVAIAAAPGLRLLRDPTRGGLASVMHEIARASGKPMLEYQSPEAADFFDNYNRFYEAIQ